MIFHILRILEKIPDAHRNDDTEILALLHDTIKYQSQQIQNKFNKEPYEFLISIGINEYVVEGLKLLTGNNEAFEENVNKIIDSKHVGAILIKLLDIEDDIVPHRLAKIPESKTYMLDTAISAILMCFAN